MLHAAESKQVPPSRHFDLKPRARSSTFLLGSEKGTKKAVSEEALRLPSRHISRKELFYGRRSPRNVKPQSHLLKKTENWKVSMEWETYASKSQKLIALESNKKQHLEMHPEGVPLPAQGLVGEKNLKPNEVLEEDIDVVEVDNGEEVNGNGFHHTENGHSEQYAKEKGDEKGDTNSIPGPDVKSVLRLKSSRRNSTSSRSSSVSSAPSVKLQTPSALQMEVSLDEVEKEHMEPLVMEGTAEDLEVSMYGSHCDADDGNSVTTDSEIAKPGNAEYDYDDDEEEEEDDEEEDDDDVASEDSWEQLYVQEMPGKKAKASKAIKATKTVKPPQKPKPVAKASPRPKAAPRAKSLKLKSAKQTSKISENFAEKPSIDIDKNSDSNSVSKDDSVVDDVVKSPRSPSKRAKTTSSKQDHEEEIEEKGDVEHAPRRSSRPRQTPQKYNSSLYVDSNWDISGVADDRLNNSDAAFGNTIRSVKGRRSLRKSRNISSLNASLHDESSPWDTEFKVLTPCGDGLSVHNVHADDKVDSSTPLKRKANDDDDEEDDKRGQKKMCVETTDLENSASSSFFSVITSPIMMLKNKLRGSSVSSSTPIRLVEEKDGNAPSGVESMMMSASEIDVGENVTVSTSMEKPVEEAAQESRSWCIIM